MTPREALAELVACKEAAGISNHASDVPGYRWTDAWASARAVLATAPAGEPMQPNMTDDQIDAALKAEWPRFASYHPNVRERMAFRIGARGRWLCARADAETPCTKLDCTWPQCMTVTQSAPPTGEVAALIEADDFLQHSGNQRAILSGKFVTPSARHDWFIKVRDLVHAARLSALPK